MDMSFARQPVWVDQFRNQLRIRHGQTVEMVETHISWVLLVGNFAYKLKKPVVFPFLDYGSPFKRRFFCEEELRLNRRFAPELYIELVPVPHCDEWAVKMHRFDEVSRLDHVCARGALTSGQVSQLAKMVVDFQSTAASAPPTSEFGKPETILQDARDNFSAIKRFYPAEPELLERLQKWTEDQFNRQRELIAARRMEGRVREGHGDLHLANLALIKGRVLAFDCIEFSEKLRWIDVVSEIAFTYVDLLKQQRPDLAGWFINEWLANAGDYEAMFLLRFFALSRAMVRARVALIRGDEDEAKSYLTLGAQLIDPAKPSLMITCGLSGSGKTTQTKALILDDPAGGLIRIRSDVERKRLFGIPPGGNSHSYVHQGLFDLHANELTYACLANRTADLLSAGWSVVVDATFLEAKRRSVFRALADHYHANFSILDCEAPIDTLIARIMARRDDASEATVDVLIHQLSNREILTPDERIFVDKHALLSKHRHAARPDVH